MVRTRVGARPQIKDSGMPKNVRKRVREKERNQVLVKQQMSTDERKILLSSPTSSPTDKRRSFSLFTISRQDLPSDLKRVRAPAYPRGL